MFRLFGCLWPPVVGQVVHSYSATVAQLLAALDKSPGYGRAEGPTDAGKCLIGGRLLPILQPHQGDPADARGLANSLWVSPAVSLR